MTARHPLADGSGHLPSARPSTPPAPAISGVDGHPGRPSASTHLRQRDAEGLVSGGPPEGGGPLVITVLGKPAPQGSKRHVGGGRMIEQSKRVVPWREAVKEAAVRALQAAAMERYGGTGQAGLLRLHGPVLVEASFTFDKPKSAPKRRRTWPVTRSSGDIDKLLRSCFDALADAGVYWDDSQVIEVHARKVFTDDADAPLSVPGAVLRIWEAS